MSHQPTSQQITTVIEAFKSVLPMAILPCHLNMGEGNVNHHDHECGSVHCHWGWYAIAKGLHITPNIDFREGGYAMAKDLGFSASGHINSWAMNNPELWGNENGRELSYFSSAFIHPKKRRYGAQNLQHIIDHWTEVRDRVFAIEQQQKRVDITAELAVLPVEEMLDSLAKDRVDRPLPF